MVNVPKIHEDPDTMRAMKFLVVGLLLLALVLGVGTDPHFTPLREWICGWRCWWVLGYHLKGWWAEFGGTTDWICLILLVVGFLLMVSGIRNKAR